MKRYYLAIDIGASSGRHILGHMEEWENGSRGSLPFPEWNAETGR